MDEGGEIDLDRALDHAPTWRLLVDSACHDLSNLLLAVSANAALLRGGGDEDLAGEIRSAGRSAAEIAGALGRLSQGRESRTGQVDVGDLLGSCVRALGRRGVAVSWEGGRHGMPAVDAWGVRARVYFGVLGLGVRTWRGDGSGLVGLGEDGRVRARVALGGAGTL